MRRRRILVSRDCISVAIIYPVQFLLTFGTVPVFVHEFVGGFAGVSFDFGGDFGGGVFFANSVEVCEDFVKGFFALDGDFSLMRSECDALSGLDR